MADLIGAFSGLFLGIVMGVAGLIGGITAGHKAPQAVPMTPVANHYYSRIELGTDPDAATFDSFLAAYNPDKLNGMQRVNEYIERTSAKGYKNAQVFVMKGGRVWYSVYVTFSGDAIMKETQVFRDMGADIKVTMDKDDALALMGEQGSQAVVDAYLSGRIKIEPSGLVESIVFG